MSADAHAHLGPKNWRRCLNFPSYETDDLRQIRKIAEYPELEQEDPLLQFWARTNKNDETWYVTIEDPRTEKMYPVPVVYMTTFLGEPEFKEK